MNKIVFKKFELKKTINKIKDNRIVFFFHSNDLDSADKLKLDQNLKQKNFKLIKIKNNLFKIISKDSVFNYQRNLVKGSMCILYQNDNTSIDKQFKNILKIDPNLTLIAIKLNNKVYSKNQLNKINTINYLKNLKVFAKILNKVFKTPYKVL